MPQRYYNPPQLRYLKARLAIFQKPAVWRSGFFLLISILAWQYSSYGNFWSPTKDTISKPAILTNKPELNLSSESQGIAADIDNIPVLLDDFQKAALYNKVIAPDELNTENNQNLFKPIMSENSRQEGKSNNIIMNNKSNSVTTYNQFIVETDNLLRFSADNSKNQSFPINNINISKSSNELTNINSNNLYQIPHTTSVIPNNTTGQSSNSSNFSVNNSQYTNNTNYINNINSSTINTSTSNNNLGTQTSVPNNSLGYMQPIAPNIDTQPANISGDSSKIINNNSSLPVNSLMPNNTAIPNSNIPGGTSNYSGYIMTPLNQSQPSNNVTPGY